MWGLHEVTSLLLHSLQGNIGIISIWYLGNLAAIKYVTDRLVKEPLPLNFC